MGEKMRKENNKMRQARIRWCDWWCQVELRGISLGLGVGQEIFSILFSLVFPFTYSKELSSIHCILMYCTDCCFGLKQFIGLLP